MAINAISVDQREPEWVFFAFAGLPTVRTMLDTGDVWAAADDDSMLVIERKTPTDLLSTLAADRLFTQCSNLAALSPWAYLVITGTLLPGPDGKTVADGRETGWNYDAVQGALLTVQELGVRVVTCRGDADFAQCVVRLSNRSRKTLPVGPARQTHVLSGGEAVLASLPGIGFEKVQSVLGHCGTPAWALSYLTLLGENGVAGIGDGTKRGIRRALGLDDDLILTVISREEQQR